MELRNNKIYFSRWNFFSLAIIVNFAVLQVIRWRILPLFMDIHYHILTAWGFLKAGGYAGWDFWQYAPVGRVHIYPPLFHLIAAFLLRSGINPVVLSKLIEVFLPAAFVFVLWNFTRRNYGERLAFFVMLTANASFPFYVSLINHAPATLAFIWGLLALGELLKKKVVRSALLLALCFYTHIGVSWYFGLSFVFSGFLCKEYRRACLKTALFALILSSPMLAKQLLNLKHVSSLGMNLNESQLLQFKIFEYILALAGIFLSLSRIKEYWLFLSLFLASFPFLFYPYRFFSAEGYFPILFLAALAVDRLFNKAKEAKPPTQHCLVILIILFFIMSPTIFWNRKAEKESVNFSWAHSAFTGMVFSADEDRGFSHTMWFPDEYLSTASLIRQNSAHDSIIYSSIDMLGVIFASISGRATSNALFPEIKAYQDFDPLAVAKLIIFAKDEDPAEVSLVADRYRLRKVEENKLFAVYDNPYGYVKINVKKAPVSFLAIILICFVFILLFWQGEKLLKIRAD